MPIENDPFKPSGPGSDQPKANVDPNVVAILDQIAKGQEVVNQKVEQYERLLKQAVGHVEELADKAGDAEKTMKEFYRTSDDIQESYKATVAYAKKLGKLKKEELDDAKTAREHLEKLKKMYEDSLANAKKNTKESEAMRTNLEKINLLLKQMATSGTLVGDEWQKVADIFHRAERSATALAAATANLSKRSSTLKGLTGILGAMGIGKGISNKIDRRLEQIEEVKEKVKENRENRQAITFKRREDQRAGFVEQIKKKAKESGFGDLVDEQGQVTTKTGRNMLAKKMGFTEGTAEHAKFIAGEEAGGVLGGAGAEAGSAASKGWMEAMTSAEGAVDMLVGGFEDLILELTVAAPEIMIPLELLGAAILAVVEIFKSYAAQNKEMEKQLGQAGLFTQMGVGPGTAFANTRAGLTPDYATAMQSGFSYERNLAMAGAMANAGYTPNASFARDAEGNATGRDVANQGPGGYGQFMRGSFGEAQRVVMGVSRVGGLDDAQGVQNLVKLLGEYRETMASSEVFMTQLNKDTQAAGISTTKYIKIIDEVSGAFDRMGKSLEEVTGIMRDLSRYGDVSSESLKDMMEFLAKGQQKTTESTLSIAGYTQSTMENHFLKTQRQTSRKVLTNMGTGYDEQAAKEGKAGMSDVMSAIDRGDYDQAFALLSAKDKDIDAIKDPNTRKTMKDKQTQIAEQIKRYRGMMSNDPLARAASSLDQPEDLTQSSTELLSNITQAAKLSGQSLEDAMQGKGSFEQKTMFAKLLTKFGVKDVQKGYALMRQSATNRLEDVDKIADPTKRKDAARLMFREWYKESKSKGGLSVAMTAGGIGGDLRDNADDTFDAIQSQGKDAMKFLHTQRDTIAASSENADSIIASQGDASHATTDELAKNLDTMEGISERTQSVTEMLEKIFKPLLNNMLGYIEQIATDVDKALSFFTGGMRGGDLEDQQKRREKDMGQIGPTLDKLFKSAETMRGDKTKDAQLKKTEELIKYLQGIDQQGGFMSPDQQGKFEDAMKSISSGDLPDVPGAADDMGSSFGKGMQFLRSLPAVAGAAAQVGSVVIHQQYDSHFNHDTAQPSGVGTSKERATQQKGKPMGIDPTTNKPFTSI